MCIDSEQKPASRQRDTRMEGMEGATYHEIPPPHRGKRQETVERKGPILKHP